MHCTLLIPHLLWPREESDVVARDLALPALTQLLARAQCDRAPASSREAWLCRAFAIEREQDWPVAPLTLARDGVEPGSAYWLRADPVHLQITRDRAVLVESTLFDTSTEETRALVAALDAYFSADGMSFHAPHGRRWYARLSRPPRVVTHTISEVAGQDVRPYLPSGADALTWHRIVNDVQMLLHAHPVNEAREARGDPPVNSVWFWGGGVRARAPVSPYFSVAADDELALALAFAAGTEHAAAPVSAGAWLERLTMRARGGSHLVVLDELATAVAYQDSAAWRTRIVSLENRWFAPVLSALRAGRLSELHIVALGTAGTCRFIVRRGDLLKLWRRAKALSAYA